MVAERLTEREHEVLGREMPREEFVALCRKTSAKYERDFEELWRGLGFSADWSLCYSTIDERCIRISQRAFLDLYAKGEVYQRTAPTLWDTETQTAVAQAELESKDQRTKMNELRFDLEGGGEIVIATTRPELLGACVSIFIHPQHPRAEALLGKQAIVPLFGHSVTIRADEKVDPEKGTGIVMCCTFGDKTDVEWYQKHDLDLRALIGRDGRLTELAGPEAGLFAKQARRAILERLEAAGHLLKQEDVENVVSIYERTGREIEFLATRQWYVRLLDKKDKLIELGRTLNWYPTHMGKRYENWVEGLEWDWNISRQRFYGVPFPVWHCESCEHIYVAPDEALPILDHSQHDPGPCTACGATDWRAESDVMDTWATSSETPQINARWGDAAEHRASPLPMTMRPQAHDIIRTWAFYTVVKSWIHHEALPWQDVMVSGHVQAPGKKKISKSKGNAPTDPRTMIENHGADATRYWALSATLGNDYVYNEEDFKAGRRLCVKLWNASRFAGGHLASYDPTDDGSLERTAIDRWILGRLGDTIRLATNNLERYEFGIAKGDVERFFWNDLCDNYLEMAKNRLYDDSEEGAATRRGAQATLYDVLFSVLRLFHPFVPHVCEAVYQGIFKEREGPASLLQTTWPQARDVDDDAEAAGAAGVVLLTAVRRWRSEQKLSPGKPLERVHMKAAPDVFARLGEIEEAVRAAGRIEALVVDAAEDLEAGTTEILEVERPPEAS